MRSSRIFFFYLFFCFVALTLPGFGQRTQHYSSSGPSILDRITEAYRSGQLSLDQKILYEFYTLYQPDKIPSSFGQTSSQPIKCFTPVILEYHQQRNQLSPSTVSEIESMMEQSVPSMQAQETYHSPDGKFIIYYDVSGANAIPTGDADTNGIPDFVDWTAAAADSSWRHEVNRLEFTDPVKENTDPYPIFIENTDPSYGYTNSGSDRGFSGSTYMVINSHLNNPEYLNNDDSNQLNGAIKVTVAHEFKHAIQYAMTEWTGESDLWAEMDATLMEEVVYDNVNDYYNYLNYAGNTANSEAGSIFETPQLSFYPASYYQVTWALYFEQTFGSQFWVDMWNKLATNPRDIRWVEAMTDQLGGDDAFQKAYVESELWHLASGSYYSAPDYGFEERQDYPNPTINLNFKGEVKIDTAITIQGFAANYIFISPREFITGSGYGRIRLTRTNPNLGVGIIAYLDDRGTQSKILAGGNSNVLDSRLSWKWDEVQRLGVVVANSSETNDGQYTLEVTSETPDLLSLKQNFPNPFNPSTTIPFTLTEKSDVRLRVYDIMGRLIQTLVDETLPAGFYNPTFKTERLASGVYLYQLKAQGKVLTKKMTLIK